MISSSMSGGYSIPSQVLLRSGPDCIVTASGQLTLPCYGSSRLVATTADDNSRILAI
jgi:hypothetical protein